MPPLTRLKNAAYVCLLWVCLAAFPFSSALAGSGCAPLKVSLNRIFQEKYAFLSTAVTDRGFAIAVFINQKNGSWEIIGIDEDENSCVIASGTDWKFAAEQEI